MKARVAVPVTVKCRIGIDEQDGEIDFQRFVETIADAGCGTFVVHARKAWLKGLSPKENREMPPLDYGRVYRLKAARPDLTVVINGGIATLDEAAAHLAHVDGVMLGRAAYHTPYVLADVDRRFFGDAAAPRSRGEVAQAMLDYAARHVDAGGRLNNVTRHMLGLYHGRPRARLFRRHLSESGVGAAATAAVLADAIAIAEGEGLRYQVRADAAPTPA